MGNSVVSKVKGKGKVILKWMSEKKLTLNDVLYALDIHKNLIFGSIHRKKGLRMVFESDKFVLSKGECMWVRTILLMAFQGQCCCCGQKVRVSIPKLINKESSSIYFLESPIL